MKFRVKYSKKFKQIKQNVFSHKMLNFAKLNAKRGKNFEKKQNHHRRVFFVAVRAFGRHLCEKRA